MKMQFKGLMEFLSVTKIKLSKNCSFISRQATTGVKKKKEHSKIFCITLSKTINEDLERAITLLELEVLTLVNEK